MCIILSGQPLPRNKDNILRGRLDYRLREFEKEDQVLIEDGRGNLNLVIILLQEKKRVLLGTCNAWSTVSMYMYT